MDRRRKQNNRNDDSISAVEVEPQETIRGQSLSTVRHGMDCCEKEGIELLGVILTKENLTKALKRVETNKGVAGVDGIKTGELREYLKQEWPRIREELLEGNYKPSPVRRAGIRKPDGGIRLLGIPTVLDRMIQQAMTQVISPIFEKEFSNHSHGFRPGRKAHDAVLQAKKHIEDGYSWVVDIDLEKFFDRVNHDILMSRVARKIGDKKVLKLIRKYLESGIMINGVVMESEEGTPQGGPLSPLLSNIMLDDLDKELEKRGHRFERYADDCNIYVKTERAGKRVYDSVKEFLEKKLKLKVNEAKSAVDRPWKRKFLGFSFYVGQEKVGLRLSPKVVKRVKDKIRTITKRNRGTSVNRVIYELNEYLRGFIGYYRIADMKSFLEKLDGWIRRKVRVIIWKHWKKFKTRVRKLQGLGLSQDSARMIASCRKSYWRVSDTPQVHMALGKGYFESVGLVSAVGRYSLVR